MKRFWRQRIVRNLLNSLHKRMGQDYPPLAIFNYDVLGRYVACDGYHEINFLECLAKDVFPILKSHHICLDIGANIGNHSVFFSNYFQKTYAYEPNLRPFKLLEANAMLKDNIKPFNFALSNTTKKQKVIFELNNTSIASLVRSAGKGTHEAIFQLKCLDKVLRRDEIGKISFMKIDVEGNELNVLKGAARTIEASKPVIVLEVLKYEIQNGTFATKEFLETLGYKFFYIFEPKRRFKFIPNKMKTNIRRELIFIEAPQKFAQTGYPMVVCAPYDLKA